MQKKKIYSHIAGAGLVQALPPPPGRSHREGKEDKTLAYKTRLC